MAAPSPRAPKPVAPVAMARKKSGFAQLLSKGSPQQANAATGAALRSPFFRPPPSMSGPPAESRPKVPLKRGKLSPMRAVPPHIPRPPYADSGISPPFTMEPQTCTVVHAIENKNARF
ncbi:unnamed protein product [Closterium sp. NIES-64]|nr:unnamed protein product [Closterium sp. NIES-64]